MSYRPARGYIMRPCPKAPKRKKEGRREGRRKKGTKESRVVYLWVSVPSYPGIEEGWVKDRNWGRWNVRRVERVLGRKQRT